jgi:hypothetical protein
MYCYRNAKMYNESATLFLPLCSARAYAARRGQRQERGARGVLALPLPFLSNLHSFDFAWGKLISLLGRKRHFVTNGFSSPLPFDDEGPGARAAEPPGRLPRSRFANANRHLPNPRLKTCKIHCQVTHKVKTKAFRSAEKRFVQWVRFAPSDLNMKTGGWRGTHEP